jgi:Na+/H+ antiporter NhaD/arsenite permease-like protein
VSLAWISVAALLLAVVLSCTTTINIGVLALALAFIVGVFFGDMSPDDVLAGFPTELLFTLVSVTLLFSIANCNGTLSRFTDHAVRLCKGNAAILPAMFFLVGFVIATIGAGATPASALLAPPAMAAAARAGIPPLVMVVVAGNGVLAGTLSPFAPTGIVAHEIMARIGLDGYQWVTFGFNAFAHALVAIAGFILFGGLKLFGTTYAASPADTALSREDQVMQKQHWLTIAGITGLIIAVVAFSLDVGMVAIIIAAALILLRTVDEAQAIKRMPWGVILMVTGVTVLVAMLKETRGMELITTGIATISTPATIEAVVAFGAGFISVYSSTSGVVLPAFLPMVPSLAEQLGGIDPLSIAWSIAVSASLVDLSSLSTVGALYMAGAAEGTDTRKLFNALLIWGLSMSVVGAFFCWIMFSWIMFG